MSGRGNTEDARPSDGQTVDRRVRRRIRRATWGSLLLLCAIAVAGCGGGSSSESGDKATLTIGVTSPPASMDPARDGGSFVVARALSNEALIHVEPDGSFTPGLATDWEYVGEGNTTFELHLRDGVRFSDGSTMDAAAVKAWFEYFSKANGIFASAVGPIASIETPDESTVRINLENSNPTMPLALSELNNWGAVSSPKAVQNPDVLGNQTFGAGPYVLDGERTVTGQQYTYVPNKYYYNEDAVHFRSVTVKVIPDASSMLQALKTGQIDVAQGDIVTADAAKSEDVDVMELGGQPAGLIFADRAGQVAPQFAKVEVRQAMNYSINRDVITKALYGDYGKPSSQMRTLDGWNPEYDDYYSYDPDKAKLLLDQAGYPDGFQLKALVFGGSGTGAQPLAQAIAEDLSKVGIDLQVTNAPTAAEYTQKRSSKEYPVTQLLLGERPMTQLVGFLFDRKGALNPFGASSPELDALWKEGNASSNPEESWKAISAKIVEQAYVLNVLNYPAIWYVSPSIEGFAQDDVRTMPLASEWSRK